MFLLTTLRNGEHNLNKQVRQSNFEFLRIIAMILIVFHHVDLIIPTWPPGLNFTHLFLINLLGGFGKIGVNLFVLITGYFMWNKTTNMQSGIRIWVETIFYGWISLIVGLSLGHIFSFRELLTFIFPVLFSLRWFATAYLILYILIPFINPIIVTNKARKIVLLLSVLLFVLSVMPTLRLNPGYSDVGWLIFVYLLGACFAKYEKSVKRLLTQDLLFAMTSLILIFIVATILVSLGLGKRVAILHTMPDYLLIQNSSLLSLLASCLIFLIFSRIHFQSDSINKIASLMFGIYLFHAPIIEFILPSAIDLKRVSNSWILFISYLFVAPLVSLMVFGFIEFLRIKLLGKVFDFTIAKISGSLRHYDAIIEDRIHLKKVKGGQ